MSGIAMLFNFDQTHTPSLGLQETLSNTDLGQLKVGSKCLFDPSDESDKTQSLEHHKEMQALSIRGLTALA